MRRFLPLLGYGAAGLGLLAAILTPFLLIPVFTRAVAGTGIQVAPMYSGGTLMRSIDKGGYRILVNKPVRMPNRLVRGNDFVQIVWTPAGALPARVADDVDIDGDSKPDLRATFDVPAGKDLEPQVVVEPLSGLALPFRATGTVSMTALIARAGDSIILRAPLQPVR